jgi:fibronectin type 3 domain-containing protein
LEVVNDAAGALLRWVGDSPRYRVLRARPDAPVEADRALVPIGETEASQYTDTNTTYGTQYRYVVVAFSDEQHQSLGSEPRSITPVDVFAPAVPIDLMAEAGPQSVELGWTHNAEGDFQGYNVLRSLDGGPFEIVGPMLSTPAYSDRAVEAGKQYRYTVSAIDMLGNESAASAAVTAVLP